MCLRWKRLWQSTAVTISDGYQLLEVFFHYTFEEIWIIALRYEILVVFYDEIYSNYSLYFILFRGISSLPSLFSFVNFIFKNGIKMK